MRLWIVVPALLPFWAFAQEHSRNVITSDTVKGVEMTAAITDPTVDRYVLEITPAWDTEQNRLTGGASIVECDGEYFLATATHVWAGVLGWFVDTDMRLRYRNENGQSENSWTKIDLKQSLRVRRSKDMFKIQLPTDNPLVLQALKEKRILKCLKGSPKKGEELKSLGRPKAFSHADLIIKCTFEKCFKFSEKSLGHLETMGEREYNDYLEGISGGPVLLTRDGVDYFVGVNSCHHGVSKDQERYGPISFFPFYNVSKWDLVKRATGHLDPKSGEYVKDTETTLP